MRNTLFTNQKKMRMLSAATTGSRARMTPSTPCFEALYCGTAPLWHPARMLHQIGQSVSLYDKGAKLEYVPIEPIITIAFQESGVRFRLT
jgi:hypothetical protein